MVISSLPMAQTRALLALGLPLVGSQLAQFLIGLTDTVMVGWYGVTELAAVTLAQAFYFTVFIMGAGFAWAVMPMIASAAESGDDRTVRRITRMGLWAVMAFALVALPFLLSARALFTAMGQDPAVIDLAATYLDIAAWTLVPGLLFMGLRSYLAAMDRARTVLWAMLLSAALNALANYALIFGNWGAPELGVRGAAIASVAMQTGGLLLLAAFAAGARPEHALFARLWRPDWAELRQVVRLGWPIGVTNLAEVGLFASAAVIIGWIGPLVLAAHGIALQLATAAFMVHLGLSQAATILAGRAHGRGDPAELRQVARAAIALSVVVAGLTMLVFLAVPKTLIGLFLDPADPARPAIIAVGSVLLAAAALFQLADGLQVNALGLLRGVQDTRVPMIHAAISYWAIGAPAAYGLGILAGFGGMGVWLGLALGLSVAAILMLRRFWTQSLPGLVPGGVPSGAP